MRRWCIAAIALILAACDPQKVYEDNASIPDEGWKRTDVARFGVHINDVNEVCNVYINVRNNSNYQWQELWLFVNVYAPDGNMQRDTVKVRIADERGQWMGGGLGDKFNIRYLFRDHVRFAEVGDYVFEYEQAMRIDPLPGIEDVGLRVEKVKQ